MPIHRHTVPNPPIGILSTRELRALVAQMLD